MNKLILLLATFCYLSSCNHNTFNKTLKGKKFFALTTDIQSTRRVMANTPIIFETIAIQESEFLFLSDTTLKITPTTIFINFNKDMLHAYLKEMESNLLPKKYLYNYKNGTLEIYEAGLKPIKIEEHDNFFSTSDGETFYKQSIATLTDDEKRDRIGKIITVKGDDMERLLKSEMAISGTVTSVNIGKKNNEENSSAINIEIQKLQQLKKNTDTFIGKNGSQEIFVKIYGDQILHKKNNELEDNEDIELICYIIRNSNRRIIAITEEPQIPSGDAYFAMTHYFDSDENTYATERLHNSFYSDMDSSIFKAGKLYKRKLIEFFDRNFSNIQKDYTLTDENNNILTDPSGEELDIIANYKSCKNLEEFLKERNLDLNSNDYDHPNRSLINQENGGLLKSTDTENDKIDNSDIKEEGSGVMDFNAVEVQPTFVGGMQAFYKWVSQNYRYPEIAMEQGLNGAIQVSFVVERDGSLTDIKVLRDLGNGTGEEAIRMLETSPKWKPGIQNGRPVRVFYSLPIKLD